MYSPDRQVLSETSISLEVIDMVPLLDAHPPYESCSPSPRNVFKGDDDDKMVFIPYSDDPSFNQVEHSSWYESFSWQEDFDPDLQAILLEASYRLHTRHALEYKDIEKCGVLPLKLASCPGKPGLIAISRRRQVHDPLIWSGNSIPAGCVFPSMNLPSNLRQRLQCVSSLFCPNLNCMEPLCSVHGKLFASPSCRRCRAQLLIIVESNAMPPCSTSSKLATQKCEDVPCWSNNEIESFQVIFEIASSLSPCNLSVLCLKPCSEVYYYKNLLNPGDPAGTRVNVRNSKCKQSAIEFCDDDCNEFTPNEPCRHSGPCDATSSCPCFQNGAHCQRNCHCPSKCLRRLRGCRCSRAKSSVSCATAKCHCVESRRECDPELCLSCGCNCPMTLAVRGVDEITACHNSQIQKGIHKALEIKRSRWGLGAFLTESVKGGDLIAEYVGELIYEPTFDSRGEVATHRGRSYSFKLDSTFTLDSSYLGNPSRFIDHSSSAVQTMPPNCRAYVRLVNGEHRIGIFALQDLESGSEILMDYGRDFFSK
ncbi:hypothetical protein F5J12DRAFT_712950 [Pisolithus orientalis]|uniref:uncharacterized protein n=1 Tax=Pisolithus orientalis TaxID=936130 RepID=UPI002225A580|nr:uncharacterized protein F5J12DRAFT_712950 [Pisolithus orientalis]KAI6032780.1 hypothetical protein F5J12DRAFT_712950 [Pisolithus orientalis]